LAKMLAMCFSTAPSEMTSIAAMPVFERPSAMSVSTSRSYPPVAEELGEPVTQDRRQY
jgi:hypothetical protein